MKIVLITLEYPPQKGGVASYYGGLMEELKRQGHEGEVISGGPSSGRPEDGPLLYRWIWPRWLKGYFKVRGILKGGKGLSFQSVKDSPLPLLFVGQILPLGTIAYLLRKRMPYVVFTHGMDVLMAQRSWRKRWLVRKILAHATLVVANSEYTKGIVEKLIYGGKASGAPEALPPVIVVYPCPNINSEVNAEDVESLRRKLGLAGKKVLLTLGRVVERKGHDLVIKALPEILHHVPEAVYVVAGDGPDLGRLQKMVAKPLTPALSHEERGVVRAPSPQPSPAGRGGLSASPLPLGQGEGLQSTVRFVGAVSDEERPLYYAMCDLFVMPSRQIGPVVELRHRSPEANAMEDPKKHITPWGRIWSAINRRSFSQSKFHYRVGPDVEGFGIVFLEAAMFGKPSIGGRSGGIPEAILDGKTGALVDTSDASALARVVVQLLRDDALRHELGQNAKARTVNEFRWEGQVEKLIVQLSSP